MAWNQNHVTDRALRSSFHNAVHEHNGHYKHIWFELVIGNMETLITGTWN